MKVTIYYSPFFDNYEYTIYIGVYDMISKIFHNAKAHIRGGKTYPNLDGYAYFDNLKNGVLFTIKVYGLPKSKGTCKGRFFGLHIHEGTSCSGNLQDEFANAKMHFNPKTCPHPYHLGDLPPLLESDGYAYMSVFLNKFKIEDILGKVIVIHDSSDDFISQPSGNSGKKIACGIIEKTSRR